MGYYANLQKMIIRILHEKDEYGGTVQILPLSPRLKDIAKKMMPILMDTYKKYVTGLGRVDQEATYNNCAKHGFGLGLPHIYRGNLVVMRNTSFVLLILSISKGDMTQSTSAASALSWACKWIILCEMWLNGEISDDVAMEGNY